MKRAPQSDLMDSFEAANGYDNADYNAVHQERVTLFRDRYPLPEVKGRVLDLCCGSGDILKRFAVAFPEARYVGADGADTMLRLARRRLENAELDLTSRVELVKAYLPDVSTVPQDTPYDVVMCHGSLHHMSQPEILWNTIKRLISKDTYVFVSDLRRPQTRDQAAALVRRHGDTSHEWAQRDFFESLCAAYTKREIQKQLRMADLNLNVEKIGNRHILAYGFPDSR